MSILSGMIASGQIGTLHVTSGDITSGGLSPGVVQSGSFVSGMASADWNWTCDSCQETRPSSQPYFFRRTKYWCHKCAGFDDERGGFEAGREDWILQSVPCPDAPWPVIADWCEDHHRQPDAEWIRKFRCGQ